jgi:sigma-B regulation protein RsbU (phosphoserine phosphatase)
LRTKAVLGWLSRARYLERPRGDAYDARAMRIRWKLLILLLVIALAPLTVALWFGEHATARLGDDLAGRTREALADDARRYLLQAVKDHGRLLRLQAEMLKHNLRIQAWEVERCLAGPLPAAPEIHFAAEFEREGVLPDLVQSERHVHVAADSVIAPMYVSYTHQAFLLAPGVDPVTVADDLARLSTLLPTYQLVHQSQSDLILWQYTALENGVHTVYPGHGHYPEDFDPRRRPWFARARASGELTWSLPNVDASTRQVILTGSTPVHYPDGSFAGATGIDLRVTDLVQQVELPAQWAPDAETMIVVPTPDSTTGERALLIIARQGFQADSEWDVPIRPQYLTPDDRLQLAEMLDDITQERAAVRSMENAGRQSLWAYGPMYGTGAALVVIVPHDRVFEPALAAEAAVRRRVQLHRTVIAMVLLAGIAVVVVLAMLGSRHVTRPISELAAAADRIADGDLDAQTNIRTRDEIGELGATFNAMLPQLRDRLKLKHSLALAMEVQQSLLPKEPPRIEGLDVAGRSVYCDETGGDYYDFVDLSQLGPYKLGVAVGDVTGHGIAAALLMATARALLRSQADQVGELGKLLSHMNRHLAADVPVGRFMTLCYLLLDAQERTVRWSSAGHDPAIVFTPGSEPFSELAGGGIPLGIEPQWQYQELGPELLASGQIIVIGTDGIWEARNPQGEMYGKERLRAIIRQTSAGPADEISAAITQDVAAFRGQRFQDDDITLVVVKVT